MHKPGRMAASVVYAWGEWCHLCVWFKFRATVHYCADKKAEHFSNRRAVQMNAGETVTYIHCKYTHTINKIPPWSTSVTGMFSHHYTLYWILYNKHVFSTIRLRTQQPCAKVWYNMFQCTLRHCLLVRIALCQVYTAVCMYIHINSHLVDRYHCDQVLIHSHQTSHLPAGVAEHLTFYTPVVSMYVLYSSLWHPWAMCILTRISV